MSLKNDFSRCLWSTSGSVIRCLICCATQPVDVPCNWLLYSRKTTGNRGCCHLQKLSLKFHHLEVRFPIRFPWWFFSWDYRTLDEVKSIRTKVSSDELNQIFRHRKSGSVQCASTYFVYRNVMDDDNFFIKPCSVPEQGVWKEIRSMSKY